MKILPMMSRGVVLVHEDESIEMAPMQIWHTKNGTRLRIGRNVYFFNLDGSYDGSEHRMTYARGSDKEREMDAALTLSGENKGFAPEVPHYPPDTPGHQAEVAAWPYAEHIPGGRSYELKSSRKPS